MSSTIGPALVTFAILFSLTKYMIVFDQASKLTYHIVPDSDQLSIPILLTALLLVVLSLFMQQADECHEPLPGFAFWMLGISMMVVLFDSVHTTNKPGAWASMTCLMYVISVYDRTALTSCNMWMAVSSCIGLYVYATLVMNHFKYKSEN